MVGQIYIFYLIIEIHQTHPLPVLQRRKVRPRGQPVGMGIYDEDGEGVAGHENEDYCYYYNYNKFSNICQFCLLVILLLFYYYIFIDILF